MFERLKPIHSRVLVKKIEEEQKTESGIFLPDSVKENNQTALVIATGKGRISPEGKVIPMAVKVGDIVYFCKYTGIEAGNDHLILKEDDILGVIYKQ